MKGTTQTKQNNNKRFVLNVPRQGVHKERAWDTGMREAFSNSTGGELILRIPILNLSGNGVDSSLTSITDVLY